jgi:hypothetical protein
MSVWQTVKYWFGKTGTEVFDLSDSYDIKSIGNLIIPEKLTDANAFLLANSVAEIFFPIDFYADRISKLRYYIADKNGKEILSSQFNRLISDEINPLFSFSDLIYQYVFSLLADGNAINYLGVPSVYQTITPSTIDRWDVLQPNLISIDEDNLYTSSILNVKSYNELIRRVSYGELGLASPKLDINKLIIHSYSARRKHNSLVLAKSPLWAANKSIDVLLSVYSARYNVYANNGAAGYLAKKASTKNENFEEVIMDGNKRDEILKDINDRNGITGRRNIWGISGVPIEFVKTLATISELMPLEETLENAIKIASIFQIPPVLVPRKDQSTFSNQQTAEVTVWENGLLNMAWTVCENLTKMFRLPGVKIMFDTSNVSALKANESEAEDLMAKKIVNYGKMYQDGLLKYNEYLSKLDLPTVLNGDKYIYELNITPYAMKLGVGGTQALQLILSDANLSLEMKKNILEVVFGMTEMEALKITANGNEK